MNLTQADIKETLEGFDIDINAYSPTLGWSNVSVTVVEYIIEPHDGIQDLILGGTAPNGFFQLPVIQLYPLSVELPSNNWFKGVRISNSNGDVLRTLRIGVLNQTPISDDWCAVSAAVLQGDKIVLECSYSGGCRDHEFQLSWDGSVMKSIPGQIVLELSHNANNDSCKALLTEMIQFDLSPIIDNPSQYVIHIKSENTTVLAHQPINVLK